MRIWVRLVLAIVVLFCAAFAAVFWIGAARWDGVTDRMAERLGSAASRQQQKNVSFKDLGSLPAPVARYLRTVLKDGQPLIRSARVKHTGEFRTSLEDRSWVPFTSTQFFSTAAPGFVWDASMRMAPLMSVHVRDAYVDGKGSMQARSLAVVPVMDERDKAELNAGALQRYLAEAVWFPTALLPGGGVTWSAINDNKALATLTDSGTTVSLEFWFNEKGEIASIYTPGRYRAERGSYVPTPWLVTVRSYEERGGMRIPIEGEAEWQLPGGSQSYWKGKITDVQYEFVK